MSPRKGDPIKQFKVMSLDAGRRRSRWEYRLSMESVQRPNPLPTHNLLERFGDVLERCGDARGPAEAVCHVMQMIVDSGRTRARSRKQFNWALRKKGISQRMVTALLVIERKLSIIREDKRIYELVEKEHCENHKGLTAPMRVKNKEGNAFCVVAQKEEKKDRTVFNSYRRSRRREVRRLAGYFEL